MKKIAIFIYIILICAAVSFASDPAEGFWLSVDNRTGEVQSGWEIYQTNGVLYGKMLSAIGFTASDVARRCRASYQNFPIAGRVNELPILGTPWIFGLRRESSGRWSNGHVINPGDGSIYGCSIIFHPAGSGRFQHDALEMRGQLLLFSGSQFWRRATREEASSIR